LAIVVPFGIGFLLLLPVALLQGDRWPPPDWTGVAGLGACTSPCSVLFNAS
jgi:hypothetical protein